LSNPRKAQPPTRTGSFARRRRFLNRAKSVGNATSAIIAREAQAPAQKCGPAPNAMLLLVSRRMSNSSGRLKCFLVAIGGAEH
jgi:hypothetical protein